MAISSLTNSRISSIQPPVSVAKCCQLMERVDELTGTTDTKAVTVGFGSVSKLASKDRESTLIRCSTMLCRS